MGYFLPVNWLCVASSPELRQPHSFDFLYKAHDKVVFGPNVAEAISWLFSMYWFYWFRSLVHLYYAHPFLKALFAAFFFVIFYYLCSDAVCIIRVMLW